MHTENDRKRPAEAGFTLIELMVVIAILAMLAAIVGYNLINAVDEASVTQAKSQINAFKAGLMGYRLKYNKFPSTSEGLQALIQNDKNIKFLDANEIPKDPWGNPYIYTCESSREYKIVSYGADGRAGGTGLDADIDSSAMEKIN